MKILVCITHVPDTTTKISFTDNDTKLSTAGVQFVIGAYDDYALARAVELKDSHQAKVTVLNVGGKETEPTLRKALAIGADDAIRIDAEPTDAYFVAAQIAQQVQEGGYDLVLMGRESTDYNGAQVHGLVGEMVGWPSISPTMRLDLEGGKALITREIEGGKEKLEVALPLVAGCQEPIAEWKIPNMRGIMSARTKPLKVVAPLADSAPLSAVERYELLPPKGQCRMIDADQAEELVRLLRQEAKII